LPRAFGRCNASLWPLAGIRSDAAVRVCSCTLLHLMEDKKLKRGIASLCVGGGMGIAMAIERPDN
jgi:Thiolase, C-terminal domain